MTVWLKTIDSKILINEKQQKEFVDVIFSLKERWKDKEFLEDYSAEIKSLYNCDKTIEDVLMELEFNFKVCDNNDIIIIGYNLEFGGSFFEHLFEELTNIFTPGNYILFETDVGSQFGYVFDKKLLCFDNIEDFIEVKNLYKNKKLLSEELEDVLNIKKIKI